MEPTTVAIISVAWLWDKCCKTVAYRTAGAVKYRWKQFERKDAAEAYRAKIKKLYMTMQIEAGDD